MKAVLKPIRKRVKHIEWLEELLEEGEDFFEDLFKSISKTHKKRFRLKKIMLYGNLIGVRPAVIFAERIDNMLKILFGFSIIISGFVATVWGFTRLSDLLIWLLNSLFGRILIVLIGFSYLILGLWKLMQIKA